MNLAHGDEAVLNRYIRNNEVAVSRDNAPHPHYHDAIHSGSRNDPDGSIFLIAKLARHIDLSRRRCQHRFTMT
jgi:hypothetical protein